MEPSVGTNGSVVFQTGNWFAARSLDGGQTFSFLDPYTQPFPSVNGGFCCDQVVVYDPSRNARFWLQQFAPDDQMSCTTIFDPTPCTSTHRINVDRNGDGTWDCHYDFTPQGLGLPNRRTFDFPDLVLGANFLYHTSNIFTPGVNTATEAMISRYPLDAMANCQSIQFSYYLSSDHFGFRPTHGAGTTVYWGSHTSRTSIRIYRWSEASSTVFFDDRTIAAWNAGTSTCPGPDGRDWCGHSDARVLGAFVANGVIGFMWNASQGGSFTFPHVQVVRFQESDRSLLSQGQIFSQSGAYLYPSVGVNGRGHLGGTIFFGGGTSFPICAAWISDDVNGNVLTPLSAFSAVGSTSGPLENKWGDYLSSRPHSPFNNTWVATCYSLQGGGDNSNTRPRYLWFGRARDAPTSSTTTTRASTTTSTSTSTTTLPCALAMLGCPTSVGPGSNFVDDVAVNVGTRALGAYSFRLTFDPTKVQLASVSGGTTAEFSGAPTCNINNSTGVATCSSFQASNLNGPTGIVHVARANFTAGPTSGAMSTPTLTFLTLFDTRDVPICIQATPGSCTTTISGLCGDVNGDNVVNVGDALVVAQYTVGLRQCNVAPFVRPGQCDVNRDSACNIGDALRMAQCDVGLVSCAFTCGTFTCP